MTSRPKERIAVHYARPRIRSLVIVLAVALTTGTAAQLAGAAHQSTAKLRLIHTAGPLARATNSASFTDPTGDGSVDMTFVNVSNDDQPNVHFEINLGTAIVDSTDAIDINLDTDSNPNTGGGTAGAEFSIEAYFPDNTITLYKWNGSQFDPLAAPTLVARKITAQQIAVDIKPSDLGGTTSLNFWVVTFRGSPVSDRAPDSGSWHYNITLGNPQPPPPPTQKLKAKGFSASPNPPRAGESLVIEYDIVDAGTGKAVYAGVTCRGKLGGRTLNGTDLTRRGASFCVFDIPQSAAGSVLAGSITVFGDGGSSLTKSFRYKVVRPPVHLHFVGVAAAPTQPKQGASFLVAAGVEILEQGRPTKRIDVSAKGTCRASISGRNVPSTQSHWQGRGWLCGWSIPFSTRSQTLVVTIAIIWHGVSVSKSFQYRVG